MSQLPMLLNEAITVLKERAAYLTERVVAKQKVGWEWQYDERERTALQRILEVVDPAT